MIDVVEKFDIFLGKNGLDFEAVVIGGAALNILHITNRVTRDVDCLSEIPEEILKASRSFAIQNKSLGLDRNWLNNGPISLEKQLPRGWRARLQPLFKGKNLNLQTLGRVDLLKTKLYSFCDRTEPDFQDLMQMFPTIAELSDSIGWVKLQDQNPKWPDHVEKMFIILKEALYE